MQTVWRNRKLLLRIRRKIREKHFRDNICVMFGLLFPCCKLKSLRIITQYGLVNGYIDDLYIRHVSTSNCRATANLHNSQITTSPSKFFQPAVSSPAFPQQRLLTVEILQLHTIRSSLNSLPCRTIFNSLCPLLITSRHGPHRKHSSSIVSFVPVATGTCLLSRCPETALYIYLSRGRCVATAVHATVLYSIIFLE
jgi:hypothetical protein